MEPYTFQLERTSPKVEMARLVACLLVAGANSGCAHLPQSSYFPRDCFVEPGWMDSSAGCSEYENYPDCFLVCPKTGLIIRLEDAPYVVDSAAHERALY
jgi:hypothetical protein